MMDRRAISMMRFAVVSATWWSRQARARHREAHHAFVEGGDGFHIQVVCGLIEDQAVSAADHHLGELAAGFHRREDVDVLDAVPPANSMRPRKPRT